MVSIIGALVVTLVGFASSVIVYLWSIANAFYQTGSVFVVFAGRMKIELAVAGLIFFAGIPFAYYQNDAMVSMDLFYECGVFKLVEIVNALFLIPYRTSYFFVVTRWNDIILYLRECLAEAIDDWRTISDIASITGVSDALTILYNMAVCLVSFIVKVPSIQVEYLSTVIQDVLNSILCLSNNTFAFLISLMDVTIINSSCKMCEIATETNTQQCPFMAYSAPGVPANCNPGECHNFVCNVISCLFDVIITILDFIPQTNVLTHVLKRISDDICCILQSTYRVIYIILSVIEESVGANHCLGLEGILVELGDWMEETIICWGNLLNDISAGQLSDFFMFIFQYLLSDVYVVYDGIIGMIDCFSSEQQSECLSEYPKDCNYNDGDSVVTGLQTCSAEVNQCLLNLTLFQPMAPVFPIFTDLAVVVDNVICPVYILLFDCPVTDQYPNVIENLMSSVTCIGNNIPTLRSLTNAINSFLHALLIIEQEVAYAIGFIDNMGEYLKEKVDEIAVHELGLKRSPNEFDNWLSYLNRTIGSNYNSTTCGKILSQYPLSSMMYQPYTDGDPFSFGYYTAYQTCLSSMMIGNNLSNVYNGTMMTTTTTINMTRLMNSTSIFEMIGILMMSLSGRLNATQNDTFAARHSLTAQNTRIALGDIFDQTKQIYLRSELHETLSGLKENQSNSTRMVLYGRGNRRVDARSLSRSVWAFIQDMKSAGKQRVNGSDIITLTSPRVNRYQQANARFVRQMDELYRETNFSDIYERASKIVDIVSKRYRLNYWPSIQKLHMAYHVFRHVDAENLSQWINGTRGYLIDEGFVDRAYYESVQSTQMVFPRGSLMSILSTATLNLRQPAQYGPFLIGVNMTELIPTIPGVNSVLSQIKQNQKMVSRSSSSSSLNTNLNKVALQVADFFISLLFSVKNFFVNSYDTVVNWAETTDFEVVILDPVIIFTRKFLTVNVPVNFDGTTPYNPFALPLLPESYLQFVVPLPTSVFPMQIPWPDAIIDVNCTKQFNGVQEPFYEFKLGNDCPSQPSSSYPACPTCDYCFRSYYSCQYDEGFLDAFDNSLFFLAAFPKFLAAFYTAEMSFDTLEQIVILVVVLLISLLSPFAVAIILFVALIGVWGMSNIFGGVAYGLLLSIGVATLLIVFPSLFQNAVTFFLVVLGILAGWVISVFYPPMITWLYNVNVVGSMLVVVDFFDNNPAVRNVPVISLYAVFLIMAIVLVIFVVQDNWLRVELFIFVAAMLALIYFFVWPLYIPSFQQVHNRMERFNYPSGPSIPIVDTFCWFWTFSNFGMSFLLVFGIGYVVLVTSKCFVYTVIFLLDVILVAMNGYNMINIANQQQSIEEMQFKLDIILQQLRDRHPIQFRSSDRLVIDVKEESEEKKSN